ncbi:MAG: hypothetical protein SNJ68_06155 [Cyanobacteriota bacterium]
MSNLAHPSVEERDPCMGGAPREMPYDGGVEDWGQHGFGWTGSAQTQ